MNIACISFRNSVEGLNPDYLLVTILERLGIPAILPFVRRGACCTPPLAQTKCYEVSAKSIFLVFSRLGIVISRTPFFTCAFTLSGSIAVGKSNSRKSCFACHSE